MPRETSPSGKRKQKKADLTQALGDLLIPHYRQGPVALEQPVVRAERPLPHPVEVKRSEAHAPSTPSEQCLQGLTQSYALRARESVSPVTLPANISADVYTTLG